MCKDNDMAKLRGVIFDHACGLGKSIHIKHLIRTLQYGQDSIVDHFTSYTKKCKTFLTN